MMYYMLGYALSILWALVGSLYVVVNVIVIFAHLIDDEKLPTLTRIIKILGAASATTVLWWLVWALSFYV